MLQGMEGIYREVLHISAWSGLSLGAMGAIALIAYLIPGARVLAIASAITVAAGYGGLLYGNHTGRADVLAQWDAANVKAEKDRVARDAKITADLEAKYGPVVAALEKQSNDLQTQVTTYEKKMLASKSGSSCVLGPAALRLRIKR